jgi:predicted dehydrogenase
MTKPLRIGIIGLGGHAGIHHQGLLKLEAEGQAKLICTCDPQAAKQTKEQADYALASRGVQVFTDYRAMLAACAAGLDMVVVPTPISLHAEMHRVCVEHGVAVYLEKPPTLDYRELEEMIAVDAAAKKAALVGFNFIIERPRLALKQRILTGEFGPIREAHLSVCWPRANTYYGRAAWAGKLFAPGGKSVILDSCFGNAMAHFVHDLLFWAGAGQLMSWATPTTVRAELYRAHPIESTDTVFVESQTAEGVTLRFALTHACKGDSTQCEIVHCEKASIHYSTGNHAEVRWNDGRVETIALGAFDPTHENHLDYYRYLRGETARPATTLADSRPFVLLNNLIFISSGVITPFPSDQVQTHIRPADGQTHYTVTALEATMDAFLVSGRWPGVAQNWRTGAPAEVVTVADLPRFIPTLNALVAG